MGHLLDDLLLYIVDTTSKEEETANWTETSCDDAEGMTHGFVTDNTGTVSEDLSPCDTEDDRHCMSQRSSCLDFFVDLVFC